MAFQAPAELSHSEESEENRRMAHDGYKPPATQSLADLLSLSHNIAWINGMAFDQLVLRQHDDHVLGMVKATKGGKCYIAFVGAANYADCLQTVAELGSGGELTWRADKHPSKRARALCPSFIPPR